MKTKALCLIVLIVFNMGCVKNKAIKNSSELSLLDLSKYSHWSFNGKMSFSDGENGGSGKISWFNNDGQLSAALKAPLGQGSWQIEENKQGSKLSSSKRGDMFASSMKTLLSEEIGWPIPWDELKSWIQAKPLNSQKAEISYHQEKLLIRENGWLVEYSRFKPVANSYLPTKMVATNPPYTIKLLIRKWNL
ncbi:MAG: lipoprotein insertase outer membrane protein LolB [Proteobacteria bacterium]|nr:lipoprotein insertase outer membrane protein LolB [Pseudomonadota bacterium]